MKRCAMSLSSREIQIKTTVRYHFITSQLSVQSLFIEKTSAEEDAEKLEPLHTLGKIAK